MLNARAAPPRCGVTDKVRVRVRGPGVVGTRPARAVGAGAAVPPVRPSKGLPGTGGALSGRVVQNRQGR